MAQKEYIEREEVLRKISKMIDDCKKDYKVNALTTLFQVIDTVVGCKPADVQEIRHGEWSLAYAVPDHNVKIQYGYQCSECEAVLNSKTNFCGNCGAKMDGKDEGK